MSIDLPTAIFAALMRLTPSMTDTETPDERVLRMHLIADAINDATKRAACVEQPEGCRPILSDRRLLAALLIGKGQFESGFAQYVHEGRCTDGPRGAQCDRDRFGVVHARSLWQMWKIAIFPQDDWDHMNAATPEATELAAWHASKILASSRGHCRQAFPGDDVAAAIAGFAGSCISMAPEKVAYQARTVRKIMGSLPAK